MDGVWFLRDAQGIGGGEFAGGGGDTVVVIAAAAAAATAMALASGRERAARGSGMTGSACGSVQCRHVSANKVSASLHANESQAQVPCRRVNTVEARCVALSPYNQSME